MLVRGLDTANPDAPHHLVPEDTRDGSQNAPKPTVLSMPTKADSQDASLTALSRMLDKTRRAEAKPVAQQTPVAQVQAASEAGDTTNAGSGFADGLRALTDAFAPRNLWPAPSKKCVHCLLISKRKRYSQPILIRLRDYRPTLPLA